MKRLQTAGLLLLVALLAGCRDSETFQTSGTITGAENEILYLEETSLRSTRTIDSVRLTQEGKFRFTAKAPEYPELYRLRIGKKSVVLAVDSTEHISVETTLDNMAYSPCISGSDATLQIVELRQSLRSKPLAEHKEYARKVILSNPRSIAAYYALFQTKDNRLVFDPYDKADRPYYSAVATAFHAFMPEYERSKALYNLVTDIITTERTAKQEAAIREFIAQADNTFLDIILPDQNGTERRLSDYKGKVILLDFSTTDIDNYFAYIFELRELYNRYHQKGLEIYQVSADNSRLRWEQATTELPWTTVRSEQGVNAMCFRQYNVSALPTLFLINRQGEVVQRVQSFDKLPAAIEQCLR